MPRVRYTADGGHYRVGGHGFDPGDEVDVDGELAEYLADHDDFEVLEADDDGDEDNSDDGKDATEAIATGDADAFVDRTPVSDVADDILDGHVDEVLNEIEAAESDGRDRKTVYEAIEDRRDELGG
jgi:hypothetical protein